MRAYSVSGDWLGDPGGVFFFLLALIPFCILVTLWVLVARSGFIQGEDMERPSRVGQLYGYTVCLIAVVVFLASASSFVENLFSYADPVQARESGFGYEPSVTSYEAYRATYDRERQMRAGPGMPAAADSIPEATFRARYEAIRADRIASTRFNARRGMTTSGLSLVFALALFVVHWRWVRARPGIGAGGDAAAV